MASFKVTESGAAPGWRGFPLCFGRDHRTILRLAVLSLLMDAYVRVLVAWQCEVKVDGHDPGGTILAQANHRNKSERQGIMALMDFIKKQFIDIIQWTEDDDGTLAWRFPVADMEIQYGASLTVRESQIAVFVNEGKVADVFGPGMYKLTTQTIPVLTYLKNWDKLFESPFKSDVYFFSTRQQIDQKWGTPQPITIRDKDFGAVRLRAFGNYNFRIADPKVFHTEISGTRERYTTADLDGQLRGLVLQNISNAIASSDIAFLDLAANQLAFAQALLTQLTPEFAKIGLKLEGMTVQNVSLPEELQKVLDQKIGMGMVGNDMGKFMQYQTAQAIPKFAEGGGGGSGIAGDAMGLGAGVALGQVLAQNLQAGLHASPAQAAALAVGVKADDVMAMLEKLGELKAKGILTQDEFDAKKAELLKKLI
jgi:membrane protease subunit (stomatin/prohibitin family)